VLIGDGMAALPAWHQCLRIGLASDRRRLRTGDGFGASDRDAVGQRLYGTGARVVARLWLSDLARHMAHQVETTL
jgi:hypothetical protein